MQEIGDLIGQLRRCDGEFNAGVTDAEMNQLAELAGGWLPEDLRTLYRDHNGNQSALRLTGKRLPVRLMPAGEVAREGPFIAEFDIEPLPGRILWTWTDDNGNFVGTYVDGPLKGMLAVVCHEEIDLSPRFRSVCSFISCMLGSLQASEHTPVDAVMIPPELPTLQDDPGTIERDREVLGLYDQKVRQLQDGRERSMAAYIAFRFLPVADMQQVVPFLRDENPWISERAVELVAYRRWEPGIPELARLVESGFQNAQMAASLALLRWPNPDKVQGEFQRLSSTLTGQARVVWDQNVALVRRKAGSQAKPWWRFW